MTTPNTLNLDTVYTVTTDRYGYLMDHTFTRSELPTIQRLLAKIFIGTELHHDANGSIVDEDGLEFAEIASPEWLAYEANRQLKRVDAQADGIGFRDDIYAAPGTHDSTLILGDGTALIEGNAAEIIRALEALPKEAGWQAAWAALCDFPVTCDCGCCGMCDDTDTDTDTAGA